jgi:hypothetical protein
VIRLLLTIVGEICLLIGGMMVSAPDNWRYPGVVLVLIGAFIISWLMFMTEEDA